MTTGNFLIAKYTLWNVQIPIFRGTNFASLAIEIVTKCVLLFLTCA